MALRKKDEDLYKRSGLKDSLIICPYIVTVLSIKHSSGDMMLHLQSLNIDRLLDEHLSAYLCRQNAQMLRQHCLNISPIQPIIQAISIQLKTAAEQDKMAQTTQLQQKAYQAQLNEDQNEASRDIALTAQYRVRKDEIHHNIQSIKAQYRDTEIAISHLSGRLFSLQDDLDNINRSSTTHGHPSQLSGKMAAQTNVHLHPASADAPREHRPTHQNNHKDNLLHGIKNLNREISNLRSTLQSHDNSLESFGSELQDISGQEILIRQREIARAERHRAPRGSMGALTQANREKLDRDTQAMQTKIGTRQSEMERLAREKCHPAFMDTLERTLQGSLLAHIQNNENAALLNIIAQMRRHVADLVTLEASKNALRQSQLNLNNQLAMRSTAESSSSRMDTDNNLMSDENVRLQEVNAQLSLINENFLYTRNQFAKYALITGLLTSLTATVGFLFNATLQIIIPTIIPYILAGLAIIVTTGLLITSGVAWIKALMTQSEIDENLSKHNHNLMQIANNSQEMARLAKQQLPAIETAIQHYQKEVQTRQGHVAQAEANARSSRTEAEEIEGIAIFLPSVSQSDLGIFSAASDTQHNQMVNLTPGLYSCS